ncbi:hypothetical protein M413DRAFT_445771, partial [Hebeloma cylindrosporum]
MPSRSELAILADRTGIHPDLERLFNYSYPVFKDRTSTKVLPLPPLKFHDRHIEPSLILKSVKSLGFSMAQYLCKFCDDELMAFIRKERRLRGGRYFVAPARHDNPLTDAYAVGDYYASNLSESTTRFPSKFYYHPSEPDWNSLFYVKAPRQGPEEKDRFRTGTGLSMLHWEGHADTINELSLDEEMTQEVRRINEKHPNIAIYEMFAFCPLGTKMVRKMGPVSRFKWENSRTVGSFGNDLSTRACPPDAKTGLWSKIAVESLSKGPKRQQSKKSPISLKAVPKPTRNKGIVRDPGRRGPRTMWYHPEPSHYLQHAWCRAVENDATFIILHCGKYERIGFRHRETQTLYLSELIDPSVVPTYGKMEIGLQLLIVKDLLERRATSKKEEEGRTSSGKKRSAEGNESRGRNKRQRTEKRPEVAIPSAEVLESGLGSRDIALFRLEYQSFNSPVPSSFLRVEPSCAPSMKDRPFSQTVKGRQKYNPSEYFTLTLDEPFANGAIGTVHRASAKFEFGSTTVEYPGLAVKLAFQEEHQEQLRKEYKIYQHMAKVGYTANILRVHGLFQDCETGLLAMIMDYGGPTLGRTKGYQSFTEKEQNALWDALQGLHDANVLHGDIKSNNI